MDRITTIEAVDIHKRFGRTVALDGLSLTAEPGEVLAVLGPNGAGKTTFVRTVATLLRPDRGRLRVAGHDVTREPGAVRRMIGLAGQHAAVEPTMTGRENVEMVARLFGLDAHSARTSSADLLERLGLADVADRLARTYSGGMRRKLDLGASLIGTPRLLILDEPTTGLDPRSRLEVWDIVRELVARGTDVLLTTQYLDEADHLAGRIVIIDRGKSIASGTPRELKEAAGRNIIAVQVREAVDMDRVRDSLAAVDGWIPQVEPPTRRVNVAVGAGTDPLRRALYALDMTSAVIDDISLRSPTLDEVFMTLTGQRPTDPAPLDSAETERMPS